jgi:hypothetical protein
MTMEFDERWQRLRRERGEVIDILNQYVHSAVECEREPNEFVVQWVDDDPDEDIVAEIQAELPHGWSCEWTGDGHTDRDGVTYSDFTVSPEPL